jgi:hypothetical protein
VVVVLGIVFAEKVPKEEKQIIQPNLYEPSNLVSESFLVSAPFYGSGFSSSAGGITLQLKNNGGETYHIKNIDIIGCGLADNSGSGWYITALETKNFFIDCSPDLSPGIFSGDVTINYNRIGSGINLISKGSISTTLS